MPYITTSDECKAHFTANEILSRGLANEIADRFGTAKTNKVTELTLSAPTIDTFPRTLMRFEIDSTDEDWELLLCIPASDVGYVLERFAEKNCSMRTCRGISYIKAYFELCCVCLTEEQCAQLFDLLEARLDQANQIAQWDREARERKHPRRRVA